MRQGDTQVPQGGGSGKKKEIVEVFTRKNRGIHMAVTALIVLALLFVAYFAANHYLCIRYVDLFGVNSFSRADVLSLAGITEKTNYLTVSEKRIADRVNRYRYLEFVSLEKVWPNTLKLTLRERMERVNVVYRGVQYLLADDGMVLEGTTALSLDNGCIHVTGLSIRDIRVGSVVLCQQVEQLEIMHDMLKELQEQQSLSFVKEMNLSSPDSLYIVTQDDYTAVIGNREDLRAKIGTVRAVVQELRRRNLHGGIIEASTPGRASYRPLQ